MITDKSALELLGTDKAILEKENVKNTKIIDTNIGIANIFVLLKDLHLQISSIHISV